MTSALILIIGAVIPWVVHVSPPRQRPLFLLGSVALLVLFAVFSKVNPLTGWALWVGLVVGLATIVGSTMIGARAEDDPAALPSQRSGARRRRPEESNQPTGEL